MGRVVIKSVFHLYIFAQSSENFLLLVWCASCNPGALAAADVRIADHVDIDELDYDETSGLYSYTCRCGGAYTVRTLSTFFGLTPKNTLRHSQQLVGALPQKWVCRVSFTMCRGRWAKGKFMLREHAEKKEFTEDARWIAVCFSFRFFLHFFSRFVFT